MIKIREIHFKYKDFKALDGLTFEVNKGELFGLLGPNGSGKTTLFRILTTALAMQEGTAEIGGHDLRLKLADIREMIGVVFQSPSLDGKLTVLENMTHQGHLQGLSGKDLKQRIAQLLERFKVSDRGGDRVEKLSGGLKRRVELAKSLLHRPRLLILDEPSTGLDPGARVDLWQHLKRLQQEDGVTVLLTTHLMEEVEHCSRVAIMDKGKLVCEGTPEELKREVRKDVLLAKVAGGPGRDAGAVAILAEEVEKKMKAKVYVTGSMIQIEHDNGASLVPKLIKEFPESFETVTFRKPSLEDVFLHHTGHPFWKEKQEEAVS